MAKVKFTTNLEEDLLQEIKIKALKEKRNVNDIIEELLKKYLKEDITMLEKKIDRLEEIKGEEFTLLEMDNTIQEILESESSIFDADTKDHIEMGQYSYTTWMDEEKEETVDINIWFKVIEENEDNPLVRIIDIEEL